MTDTRDTNVHFHTELEALERKVLSMVDRAEHMVGLAVEAVTTDDPDLADRVIELDNEIDATYDEIRLA